MNWEVYDKILVIVLGVLVIAALGAWTLLKKVNWAEVWFRVSGVLADAFWTAYGAVERWVERCWI